MSAKHRSLKPREESAHWRTCAQRWLKGARIHKQVRSAIIFLMFLFEYSENVWKMGKAAQFVEKVAARKGAPVRVHAQTGIDLLALRSSIKLSLAIREGQATLQLTPTFTMLSCEAGLVFFFSAVSQKQPQWPGI